MGCDGKKWELVTKVGVDLRDTNYLYRIHTGEDNCQIIVERKRKEPEWKDITDECTLSTNISSHGGKYYTLNHKGNCLAVFSPIKSVIKDVDGYKIERAVGGTISFRVYKKLV